MSVYPARSHEPFPVESRVSSRAHLSDGRAVVLPLKHPLTQPSRWLVWGLYRLFLRERLDMFLAHLSSMKLADYQQ